MTTYRVRLDAFHGPLDLLLHLVKRQEVDVREVSVALIADQFLEHLTAAGPPDVELAGEFLITAAALLELKSRLLLPGPAGPAAEASGPAEDPRRDLVRQLVEYRKVKEAAGRLEGLGEARGLRLEREAPPGPRRAGGPPAVRPPEVWDLIQAFADLARQTAEPAEQVVIDETPQQAYEEFVRAAVEERGRAGLREILGPGFTRRRLIGIFLAVLELIRAGAITLDQPEPFGDLFLARGISGSAE